MYLNLDLLCKRVTKIVFIQLLVTNCVSYIDRVKYDQ